MAEKDNNRITARAFLLGILFAGVCAGLTVWGEWNNKTFTATQIPVLPYALLFIALGAVNPILSLVKKIRRTENLQQLQGIRQKLFDIFGRVLEDLDEDRISTESFQLFAFPWDVAIGAIRHRELTLTSQSPTDDFDAQDREGIAAD